MVARGGGAVDLEVILHPATPDTSEMLVVHLLVDTRDAMGANLVNTMCEEVASFIESLTGGKVFLRILSNLADRSLVRASVKILVENLKTKGHDSEQVRDGIIIASQFAAIDWASSVFSLANQTRGSSSAAACSKAGAIFWLKCHPSHPPQN